MKRIIFLLIIVLAFADVKAQFPSTDSLRNYNIVWITNNAAKAFTNYRLHTLLAGIIDWVDSARITGGGGVSIGIDSISALNDSTIRYRKSGTFRTFNLKGVYDHRRKVDTAYNLNDSTIRFLINGSVRDVVLPGANNYWEIDNDGNLVNKSFPGPKIEINKRLSGLDSGYVFTSSLTGSNPGEGTGYKNFWHPGKAAFRSGFTDASSFNDAFIGLYSSSFGYNATASGVGSVSLGIGTLASGQGAIAFGGSGTQATGNNSTAGGLGSVSAGLAATAFGNGSSAAGASAFAVGFGAAANGSASAAFNQTTRANGDYSAAFGEGSDARTKWGFVAGAFNQTNYSLLIPQFSIGKYSDTTNAAEVFRIGGGTAGTDRRNIYAVDSNGHHIISRPLDGDPLVDSGLVWDNVDQKIKKVAPGSGASGGAIRTEVLGPLIVYAGDSAMGIPDTMTVDIDPAGGLDINPSDSSLRISSSGVANQVMYFNGTRTFAGDAGMVYDAATDLLTFGNYKFGTNSNFSGINRARNLYGGIETNRWRDSTQEKRGILRFPFDGSGVITPSLLFDSDHEPIGFDSVNKNGSDVRAYYPTLADVHSWSIVADETLARLVGGFGASTGLGTQTIRGYRHSTWGGAIYWNSATRVWYGDGAVINDNAPGSITYDSTTGILTMTITTWMTTGSERDYKKLAATMNQEGVKVTFMVQNSSNTLLQFKITDTNGSVLPPYMFDNNTGFTFIMPTWHSQLPLGDIGGGNAWLQAFITSQANILIMLTGKGL
jgi:hypothetical protein